MWDIIAKKEIGYNTVISIVNIKISWWHTHPMHFFDIAHVHSIIYPTNDE